MTLSLSYHHWRRLDLRLTLPHSLSSENCSLRSAYVDTTILTDVLLKKGEAHDDALAALAKFDVTQLPLYAIKEFKRGPLNNYRWMYK